MAWASSSSAVTTISSTERLCPRWTTSAPADWRISAHDVDRGVVSVEQACGRHEAQSSGGADGVLPMGIGVGGMMDECGLGHGLRSSFDLCEDPWRWAAPARPGIVPRRGRPHRGRPRAASRDSKGRRLVDAGARVHRGFTGTRETVTLRSIPRQPRLVVQDTPGTTAAPCGWPGFARETMSARGDDPATGLEEIWCNPLV